jgi:hypothetical protein
MDYLMESKHFTAEQARAMMPAKKRISGSEMLMNHTYRRVKGAAIANKNSIHVNTEGFMRGAIVDTLYSLKENGFVAEFDYAADKLTVRW